MNPCSYLHSVRIYLGPSSRNAATISIVRFDTVSLFYVVVRDSNLSSVAGARFQHVEIVGQILDLISQNFQLHTLLADCSLDALFRGSSHKCLFDVRLDE